MNHIYLQTGAVYHHCLERVW